MAKKDYIAKNVIDIGKAGQQNERRIVLEIPCCWEDVTSTNLMFLLELPGTTAAFPYDVEVHGQTAFINVDATMTKLGKGRAQLLYLKKGIDAEYLTTHWAEDMDVNDIVADSRLYETICEKSLNCRQPIPEPQSTWLTRIIQAGIDATWIKQLWESGIIQRKMTAGTNIIIDRSGSTDVINADMEHIDYKAGMGISIDAPTRTISTSVDIEQMRSDLDQEVLDRQTADTALGVRIDNEATTRAAADTALETRIGTEETTRASEDTRILNEAKAYTDDEATTRASEDTRILSEAKTYTDDEVGDEATTRASEDTRILNEAKTDSSTKIDTHNNSNTAHSDIRGLISTEATNRASEDVRVLAEAKLYTENEIEAHDTDNTAHQFIQGVISTLSTAFNTFKDTINSYIMTGTSSTNQLAHKDFVNSSIASETAHYIKNPDTNDVWDSLADLKEYTTQETVGNNDYAVIQTQVTTKKKNADPQYKFDRYKFTKPETGDYSNGWGREYTLHPGFTQAQWDALMSGATAEQIAQITTNKTDIENLENSKVDKTTEVNGHALSSDVTITKGDVGLGNVDNTSDANKPVSTATQTALDLKADKSIEINGYDLSEDITLTKADVGLGNVDNTSDTDKPISSATQTALNNKLDKVTTTTTATQLYAKLPNGNQSMISIDSGASNGTIMYRDTNGRSKVKDPSDNLDIVNKQTLDSGLAGKLDKVTTPSSTIQAYVKNQSGQQTMLPFAILSGTATNSTAIIRDGNGRAQIANPSADLDIVNKQTMDSGLANKVNTSTTVNGHALSGNVTVTKSDIGLSDSITLSGVDKTTGDTITYNIPVLD